MADHLAVPAGEPGIRTIAMPGDTNPAGDIFGGWLMAQMDLAAGNVAARRARGRCATIAVERITFLSPVKVGDEVTVYAEGPPPPGPAAARRDVTRRGTVPATERGAGGDGGTGPGLNRSDDTRNRRVASAPSPRGRGRGPTRRGRDP